MKLRTHPYRWCVLLAVTLLLSSAGLMNVTLSAKSSGELEANRFFGDCMRAWHIQETYVITGQEALADCQCRREFFIEHEILPPNPHPVCRFPWEP